MFKRPCRRAGCPKSTNDNSGFCERHKPTENGWAKREARLGNRHKRGYGHQWSGTTRPRILERDNGLCQDHLERGIVRAGNHVDHVTPKSQGGTDDDDNLQTLCEDCHKAKTAKENKLQKSSRYEE